MATASSVYLSEVGRLPFFLHAEMAAQAKDQELIQAAKELGGNVPWCEEYEKMISGML